MKKIIVCDSGLGGLNIASRFFSVPDRGENGCELIYFNAYPSADCGFNKLPTLRAQEEVFRDVFEGMKKFSPDLCLVACNTLSIVYDRLKQWYTPDFPVQGIIDAAVEGMYSALVREPESALLILGTKSTVESGCYARRLIDRGISADRIRGLACPGLATLLESDSRAEAVAQRIVSYAQEAAGLFPEKPRKLLLGLCCTHFGFASPLWLEAFGREFGPAVELVDPNKLLGADFCAKSFTYKSRIDFFPGAREAMSAYFEKVSPQMSSALRAAAADQDLFNFKKEDH